MISTLWVIVLFFLLSVPFNVWVLRREHQAAGSAADLNEIVRRHAVYREAGAQYFLFADKPLLGRPAKRLRLLEYHEGRVAVHKLDGEESLRGWFKRSGKHYINGVGLDGVWVEMTSFDDTVPRVVGGSALRDFASGIAALGDEK